MGCAGNDPIVRRLPLPSCTVTADSSSLRLNQYVLGSAASSLFAQLAPRIASLSGSQYTALNQTALSTILAQPFSFSTYNLRPVDEFAGIPATTVGMLYLLVRSFVFFAKSSAGV